MKKNNLKLVLFILSFGVAFNISSMEETEKVREKEEIKEKRKNFFEDEQELKRVKLDESYFEDLPAELQTMLAQFVAGSVKDKEEVKETVKNLSNLAQTNKQLREIIKSDEFQKYLLSLVRKIFPEFSELEALILIGTPYWANKLKEDTKTDKALKDQLGKELIKASFRGDVDAVKFLLKAGADPEFSADLLQPYFNGDALLNAIAKKHEAIVRLLIQSGVKIDLSNHHDALIMAVMIGNEKIIKLLLESKEIDLNAVTDLIKQLIQEFIRNRISGVTARLQGVLEMVKDYKAKKD